MSNEAIIGVSLRINNLNEAKRQIEELEKVSVDVGFKESDAKELKDLRNEVNKLSNAVREFNTSKLNTSDFNNATKKIDQSIDRVQQTLQTLTSAMKDVINALPKDSQSKLQNVFDKVRDSVGSATEVLKNANVAAKETAKTFQNVTIYDKSDIAALKKELELHQRIYDLTKKEVEAKESPQRKGESDIDYAKRLKESILSISKEYKDLERQVDNFKGDKTSEKFIKLQESLMEKFQLLKRTTDLLKSISSEELAKEHLTYRTFDFENKAYSSFLDKAEKKYNQFYDNAKKRIDLLNEQIRELTPSEKENKDKEKATTSKGIAVPLYIGTSSTVFTKQVRAVLESVQEVISKEPLQVNLMLTSAWKTRKNQEILEQMKAHLEELNPNDEEMRKNFSNLIANVSKQFENEINLEVKNNVSEVEEEVKNGIKAIKETLEKSGISITPDVKFTEENLSELQKTLDDVSKDLILKIQNVDLSQESLKGALKYDDSTLSGLKEVITLLREMNGLLPYEELEKMFASLKIRTAGIKGQLRDTNYKEIKSILEEFYQYKKLGGQRDLLELGGEKQVQNWFKRHKDDYLKDVGKTVDDISEKVSHKNNEFLNEREIVEDVAIDERKALETVSLELSNIYKYLIDINNIKFEELVSKDFISSLENIATALSKLGGNGNAINDIITGFVDADKAMNQMFGKQHSNERGLYINTKTGDFTNPYIYDSQSSVRIDKLLNQYKGKKYNVGLHSHPDTNTARMSLPQYKDGQLRGSDLLSYFDQYKNHGIEQQLITSLEEILVFDAKSFFDKYDKIDFKGNIKLIADTLNNNLKSATSEYMEAFISHIKENDITGGGKSLLQTAFKNLKNKDQNSDSVITGIQYALSQQLTDIDNELIPAILEYAKNKNLSFSKATVGYLASVSKKHGFDYTGKDLNAFWSDLSNNILSTKFLQNYIGYEASKSINAKIYGEQSAKTLEQLFGIKDFSSFQKAYKKDEFISKNPLGLADDTLKNIFKNTGINDFIDSLKRINEIVDKLADTDKINLGLDSNFLSQIDDITRSLKSILDIIKEITTAAQKNDLSSMFEDIQKSANSITGKLTTKNNKIAVQELLEDYTNYVKKGGTASIEDIGGADNVQKWLKNNFEKVKFDDIKTSKDLFEYGQSIPKDYAEGIRSGIPDVEKAAEELVDAAINAIEKRQGKSSSNTEGDLLSVSYLKGRKSTLDKNSNDIITDIFEDKDDSKIEHGLAFLDNGKTIYTRGNKDSVSNVYGNNQFERMILNGHTHPHLLAAMSLGNIDYKSNKLDGDLYTAIKHAIENGFATEFATIAKSQTTVLDTEKFVNAFESGEFGKEYANFDDFIKDVFHEFEIFRYGFLKSGKKSYNNQYKEAGNYLLDVAGNDILDELIKVFGDDSSLKSQIQKIKEDIGVDGFVDIIRNQLNKSTDLKSNSLSDIISNQFNDLSTDTRIAIRNFIEEEVGQARYLLDTPKIMKKVGVENFDDFLTFYDNLNPQNNFENDLSKKKPAIRNNDRIKRWKNNSGISRDFKNKKLKIVDGEVVKNETPVSTNVETEEKEANAKKETSKAIEEKTEALRQEQKQEEKNTQNKTTVENLGRQFADTLAEKAREKASQLAEESAENTGKTKENEAFEKVDKSAKDAAESKQLFADANAIVLKSIVESLAGIDNEAEAFKSLGTLISKLSGKNGAENAKLTAEGLKQISEALSLPVDDNSILRVLEELVDKGGQLSDLATVLSSKKKDLLDAKGVLNDIENDKIEDLLKNHNDELVKNAKAELERISDGQVVNINLNKTKDGLIEVIGLVKTADDTFQQYVLHTTTGEDYTTESIRENTAYIAKQIKLYKQIQDWYKKAQIKSENFVVGAEGFFNKNGSKEEQEIWERLLDLANDYKDTIGDIQSITVMDREEFAGESMLRSFRINGTKGYGTFNKNGEFVADKLDLINPQKVKRDIDSNIKLIKTYYSLIEKEQSKTITGAEQTQLNQIRDSWEDLLVAVREVNAELGSGNIAQDALDNFDLKKNTVYNDIIDKYYTKNNKTITDAIDNPLGKDIEYTAKYSEQLKDARANLQKIYDLMAAHNNGEQWTEDEVASLISYRKQIDNTVNDLKNLHNIVAKSDSVDKLLSKINKDLNDNSRMPRELKERYTALRSAIDEARDSAGQLNRVDYNNFNKQLLNLHEQMLRIGKTGKNIFEKIGDAVVTQTSQFIARYFSLQDLVFYIRQAANTVKELDYELVDLRKTTSMNNSELEQFYQNSSNVAKGLGVTTQQIISQAAAWSRLGYSTKEEAETMAQLSSQFATISPGMDTETAQEGLVSTMKAFGVGVEDVERSIMDNINKIGNTMALTNEDIVDMLERSSAAMNAANNTIEETIALESAAMEITQNAEQTGTAFRTISMRIRGYDEETEELSEDLKNISGDIADLTKTASKPGGISLFTDADNTTYKSTTQILREISQIYNELTDKQQAQLLEKLGGKRGGQVLAGILNDFSSVEKALENMEQAAGSADAEMQIASDSIAFKLNALQQTWVGVLTTLADRGAIGDILDFLTRVSEVLGDIITNADLLIPILGGIGGTILSATNNGLIKQVFDENGNKTDKFSIGNFEFKELSDIINQVKNNGFNGLISSILGGEEATNQISSFKDILDSIKEIYEQDPDNVSSAAEAAAENLGIDFTDAMSDAIENAEDGEEALANFTAGLSTTGIKSKIAAVGMNLLTTALQGAAIALASFAVEYIISSLTELYNISDRLAEKSKELASEFNNTKNDIDGYKDKISELYEIINNNESSTESVTEARKELLRIQKEMIEKYGEESNVVRDVTDAIYGQVAALDRLSARKWRETLNKFEEEYTKDLGPLRGWINPFANAIEGYDSNVERMLDEYENSNLTIGQWSKESFGLDDKEYNKFIRKFEKLGGVTQELIGGSELNFNLSGNAEEVYNQLLDVQNLLDEFNIDNDAITTQVQNALEDVEPKLNYKDLFDQYTLQEEILPDKNYNQIYSDLMKANDEWKDSFEKGTQEDQENAIKNISELYGKINQIQDESVKDFLLGMYPELQSILDEYEFKVNILPNIKTEGLEGKDGDYITKILSTKGLQEGEAAFNVIKADLEEAGIVSAKDADEIQKIIDLLVKWGILQSNVTEETKNTNSILNQIASKQNIDSTLGLDFSVDENSDEIADSIATEVNDWMRSNKQMVETSLNIDIDSVDLEDLPDEFKDLNDELKAYRSMANFVVKSNKKFQASFDDLSSNLEGYKNLIDEANQSNKEYLKSTGEYSEVISKLTADVSGLTGIDFTNDNILEFLNQGENFNLLTQAIDGSEEALRSLQTQAIQFTGNEFDISAKLNTDEFNDEYNSFVNWLSTADLGTIEGTATFNNQPFVQSMLNLVAIGRKTASDIEAIFSSLGVEAKITYDEVEVPSVISDVNAKSGKFVSVPGVGYIETSTGKVQTTKIKVPKITYANNSRSSISGSSYRNTAGSPSGSGGSGGSGGNGGGGDSGSEPQEETIDWIETKISRVERDIENLGNVIENVYKPWEERNQAIIDQYNKIGEEIEIQKAAYQRYLQELNNVGLDPVWAEKVRNGQINIDTITDNKDLVDKINKYKELYDKVIAAADSIEGLRISQFDLMQKDFDNMVARYADADEFRQIGRDMADALWDAMQDSAVIIPEMIAQHYMDANHTLMEGIAADDLKIAEMTAQRARMVEAGIAGQAITDIDKQIAEAQKARLEKEIQLSQNIAQVYIDQFDNIQNRYQNVTNDIQHTINKINTLRDTAEAQGYATSSYFLEALRNENDGLLTQAASEYNTLKQHLEVAVGSGAITEGSKQWYDLMDQIQEKYERILELQKEGADITKQLRDLEWERFDKSSDALSKWREDNNFLIDILSSEDELFEDIDRDIIHDLMERLSDAVEDEGGLNIEPAIRFDDAGMAVMGLHVSNLDAYHDEIGRVDTAIEEYRKQLEASENADEGLKERLEEQIKLRQDLTKSYYDERQAIVSLWKTYYDKMLDYLQKAIDKRKEALSAEKDLYDYEKNIRSQTRDISNLEKQLMAIQGDTSEEAMNKRMKLEQQLQDAQEKLQETEYDRWKQDQETMLDNLMQDYTELTEDILKDIDTLINKTIEQTKANTTSTNETIKNLINGGEGSVTQAIGGIKNALETSLSDKNFKERIIGDGENSINTHLKNIDDFTQNFYKKADRNAKVSTNTVNENEQRNSDEKDYSSAYRLYNSSTGQHLWTNNAGERDMLAGSGWTEEGSTKMWANSTLPIYRLSSPTGDHLYTIDKNESASLNKNGWNLDGILGYANDDGTGEQVYRLYNPNNGQHFFTVDRSEYEALKALGWNDETNKNFKISTDIFKGEALSAAAFAKGGEIASQYGEDGWLLARKGEHILSLEQIKEMKDVLKAYNPLADAIKGVRVTTGFSAGASIENMSLTLNLPNVTNYDEFKTALKNDSNFAQWMSEATIGQIAGHGSLSKYRF